MRRKSHATDLSSEEIVKDTRRATRKQYSAEEKIRIVLDGLRGEDSISELCRKESIAQNLYYSLVQGVPRVRNWRHRTRGSSDEVKTVRTNRRRRSISSGNRLHLLEGHRLELVFSGRSSTILALQRRLEALHDDRIRKRRDEIKRRTIEQRRR